MIKYFIPTWECEGCGHKIDCEPTQQNWDVHFNADPKSKVHDLFAGECHECAKKGLRGKFHKRVTDQDKKMFHTILEENDVSAEERSKFTFLKPHEIQAMREKHEDK